MDWIKFEEAVVEALEDTGPGETIVVHRPIEGFDHVQSTTCLCNALIITGGHGKMSRQSIREAMKHIRETEPVANPLKAH